MSLKKIFPLEVAVIFGVVVAVAVGVLAQDAAPLKIITLDSAPLGVQAAEKTLSASQVPSVPHKSTKKAEIVVDEETGIVRIVVEGKPVVVIDSSGIQVIGDVKFTGVSLDNGNSIKKDSSHAE